MPPHIDIRVVKPAAQRTVPMQVLALGFPWTGTNSLKVALETVGYVRTDHFMAPTSPEKMNMWIEAIKAKFFGEGTPYGRKEWDQLLGDCQAVSDIPGILFAEELIAAYPDAKVATIAEATKRTLQIHISSWLEPESFDRMKCLLRLTLAVLFETEHVTENIAKARFVAHYDEVRRLVPKDGLLEFEVREGWTPLALFLGKEVPATAFSRVNDTAEFTKSVSARCRNVLWARATKLMGSLLAVAIGVPAALVIYYYYSA
ncbi:hypothetical protein FB451DRAFT_1392091 [Mycena latifolia]|nr:hypothetical protein FB451DRAFT_1392091 [Mycena latifolia]